jgi:SAM-dependent methyltransferase
VSERRYDRGFWQQLWTETIGEHPERVSGRSPNEHLINEAAQTVPGRALDAGCGAGTESIWLAARGWEVTAVDFSPAAIAKGRADAEATGTNAADRIHWIEADLATWIPPSRQYDLVFSLYVHIAVPVPEMVRRLASAVKPGGTLLMVGHRPVDPATGAPTAAAGQMQVSVTEAAAALAGDRWQLRIAEDRPRRVAGSGVDAVISARRQIDAIPGLADP